MAVAEGVGVTAAAAAAMGLAEAQTRRLAAGVVSESALTGSDCRCQSMSAGGPK